MQGVRCYANPMWENSSYKLTRGSFSHPGPFSPCSSCPPIFTTFTRLQFPGAKAVYSAHTLCPTLFRQHPAEHRQACCARPNRDWRTTSARLQFAVLAAILRLPPVAPRVQRMVPR
jgi:hypothetical protein